MTISEAITTILQALDIDEQNFRQVLRGNHPDVVAIRAALVQLADAVRDDEWPPACRHGVKGPCGECQAGI